MHQIDLKILDSRLRETPPHYATPGAAGLDLRACIAVRCMSNPGRRRWCRLAWRSTWLIPAWRR